MKEEDQEEFREFRLLLLIIIALGVALVFLTTILLS